MNISVITVNRNNREGLKKTIESVISQTEPPYEFIVIDGASTDGSAELLKAYASITYSVSEPDNGIYHAMNKGVAVAGGEYCIFMNSGDVFSSANVLEEVISCGLDADIMCGNAVILSDPVRIKRPPEEISFRFLFQSSLCHQAVFIRTNLLKEHPYDESLSIVADRKFFLERLICDNAAYAPVDVNIVNYDVTGFSSSHRFESEKQWQDVLMNCVPRRILVDYGKASFGATYGFKAYERLFTEIGRRNYRRMIYAFVFSFLSALALVRPSARFVRAFPLDANQ